MSAQEHDPGLYDNSSDEEIVLEPLAPWMVADIKKAIEEVERGEYITSEELDAEIDSWD